MKFHVKDERSRHTTVYEVKLADLRNFEFELKSLKIVALCAVFGAAVGLMLPYSPKEILS